MGENQLRARLRCGRPGDAQSSGLPISDPTNGLSPGPEPAARLSHPGVPRVSIYVETRIRGDLDGLWRLTQDPAQHERWDLRFTRIEYVPHGGESQPQRFRYATRVGFGFEVAGEGETVASRAAGDRERTSSLRFWSDDRK